MKNINRKTEFEREWEGLFKNAEMAPSEGVWDKIDSALSKHEAGYFKRRAFLFKLLAAASVIFALGVGIFSMNYFLGQNDSQDLVRQSDVHNGVTTDENSAGISADLSERSSQTVRDAVEQGKDNGESDNGSSQNVLSVAANNEEIAGNDHGKKEMPIEGGDVSVTYSDSKITDEPLKEYTLLASIGHRGIPLNSREDMIYEIDHIYLIPIMPRGASKMKRNKDYGTLLAGLDFSTGLFDPNFQQGSNVFASTGGAAYADARVESINDQLASFNTANKDFLLVRSAGQETKPELTYSYGAHVGFRVSRRIVLQTGLAYRKANTTTTTTGYIENNDSNSQIPIVAAYRYQLGGLSSVKRISETNLNNQYEFASIPVRAGYVVVDRKINMALMAGVSSEFFLNNRIISSNDEFETLTSSGNDSPYKNVYFNGSLGTMFGYTFAKNYLITVEPSYRFAINSFTKNDFYLNSYPSSFMVSFGVAYNFK
ncbi:MAG: outer membrane beta-barrel protein [Cytophagales bacterium]|nr:outer membrane beta-barrel protein [Cytophagales bacterium]